MRKKFRELDVAAILTPDILVAICEADPMATMWDWETAYQSGYAVRDTEGRLWAASGITHTTPEAEDVLKLF